MIQSGTLKMANGTFRMKESRNKNVQCHNRNNHFNFLGLPIWPRAATAMDWPTYQTGEDRQLKPLTLASLETAVVAHRAEELKNEDGHSHHGQAHDEHHHPHRWAVGFFAGKQKKI